MQNISIQCILYEIQVDYIGSIFLNNPVYYVGNIITTENNNIILLYVDYKAKTCTLPTLLFGLFPEQFNNCH